MNLQRLRTIWALSREGAERYGTNALKVFFRFRHLSKNFRVNPEEACRLGMADPSLDDSTLRRRFLSKHHLLKIQVQHNPRQFFGLTEDKAIFYAYCRGHGIIHPKVFAVIGPLGGLTGEGTLLESREECERFIREELPHQFVLKTVGGHHGAEVFLVSRKDDLYLDSEGTLRDMGGLYDYCVSGSLTSRWVFQERLRCHPDIARLTGTEALSTARLITRIDEKGNSCLLHASLKVIVGKNIIDNICDGQTGNLVADVDFETGVITQCQNPSTKWGSLPLETHPDTGVPFQGFQLPHWTAARELVERIAPKFLPDRLLGWDVALTPEGPCIIEANAYWDPPNDHDTMSVIVEALRKEVDLLRG